MRRLLGAAALGCGIVVSAAAVEPEVLPQSGPIGKDTVGRLLLIDGARVGARAIAVGARGYIVLTDDEGAHWRRARAPASTLLTAVDFVDARRGWAVGHDEVILATADAGETWTQQFAAPKDQRPFLGVLMLGEASGIAVGAYGAYFETGDGGTTWKPRKVLEEDRHLNAIVRVAKERLLIVGEAGTILASDDAGKTWIAVASPYKGSLFGALVARDGAVVIFGLRGHIYRSVDAGRTWKPVDNASAATLMGGTRLPDGTLVIVGAAGTALVSRDDGQSFVPLATGTTRAFSKALAAAPEHVMLLGEAGAREIALPSVARR